MKKVLGILLALTLVVAGAAIAQPAPQQQHPRPGAVVLVKYLQLTQDQITAWQQIEKDTQATVAPLAQQLPDIEKQVQTALQAATPDPAAVGKLVVAADSLRDQIKALHDTAKMKREALLTPDQKTKLAAFEAAVEFLQQQRPQGRRP